MSQPIRTLARALLVPAALTVVTLAGQSAASASTLAHYRAPVSTSAASSQVHFASHRAQHVFDRWA
jgi:hypothetical protein